MYSLRFTAHSEVGRVRKNNQDAGYASPTMLLVTDGMGGAAAGDLASAVASTEAARSDARLPDGQAMLDHISGVMDRANQKLADLIEDNLNLDGMGTTFCGAMFNGEQFGIGHVGDSRGYLLRDGALTQITHDHSWVQSLIDEGKITPAQAAVHPHRSLILKVLNGQMVNSADLDLLDAHLGDRLLFCSDGLSGLVDADVLTELLSLTSLEEAATALAGRANANGGHDNITVVIGEVLPSDEELDAAPGLLVGSATEVAIPLTTAAKDQGAYPGTQPNAAEGNEDHNAAEVARYAPEEPRRRWPGVALAVLAIALALGLGTWGLVSYTQTRYYVAADDTGRVAIYNGMPGNLFSLSFNELVHTSDTAVEDLPRFYQRAVHDTIAVPDAAAGQATLTELSGLAERCVQAREATAVAKTLPPLPAAPRQGSPSPSATPRTSLDPAPRLDVLRPSSLGTPTDAEEADPEAC